MNGWTVFFLAAVVVQLALRRWLARRQSRAVVAHRDHVPEGFEGHISLDDQRKAADYTVSRTQLSAWGAVVDAITRLGLTIGGGVTFLGSLTHGTALVLTVVVVLQCVALPFDLWRTFGIEARFGFNRITLRLYVLDLVKQSLLAFALLAPSIAVFLWLMTSAGVWWWVYGWALWMSLSILITWVSPTLIAPLFNRFEAVTDVALLARIQSMLSRCGFTAGGGVYVMDSSRRTAHGNAHFAGVGRAKRIVLYDTLLSRIGAAEVEAVLAHELGHLRLHHVRQQLILGGLSSLLGMALLGALANQSQFYRALGVDAPSAAKALALFILVAPVATFFVTPLRTWFSRRQERAADDFAIGHAPATQLVSALTKLYRDNASTLTPDRIFSSFYDSHPPAVERIARLRSA